jgi:poly-gamma-glutamate synthesis protein (capsule biosynthesis protein)
LLAAAAIAPASAVAQTPEPPTIAAPGAVAPGGRLVVRAAGLVAPARLERRRDGVWRATGEPGDVVTIRAPLRPRTIRVRMRGADGRATEVRRVKVRPLVLAAVGDVNLGDGPGTMMALHGYAYPWSSVGPTLRRADLAFANLECAVSRRGSAQTKKYTFRGHPDALKAMRERAGVDVVNLANNHAGDFGDRALLDTLRHVRANGMTLVGAGATEAAAYRPKIVERLGLRIAFVGFSNILPFEFRALGRNPGTAWAFPARVAASVRRARRDADVVIATFHWGTERATTEAPAQRALARLALDAGATAVIGAHPHVLQPIRRPPGKLVAYSVGNFVFSASGGATASTGILRVRLGRRRVLGAKLLRATIHGSRPVMRGVG